MRITWNESERTFELQFAPHHFQDDLDHAKAAGFKTTGPPEWTWYSVKVKPLIYLRKNRPASDLSISTEALEHFKKKEIEEGKKEEVLKALKEAKKKEPKRPIKSLNPEEKRYEVPFKKWEPPEPPSIRCIFCADPVYEIFELLDPLPVCLWCEKTISDEQGEE